MTDLELLRTKMDESGYKLAFIAKQMGITYQGLLKKMQGNSEFKISEVQTLRKLLSLSDQDVEKIFFTPAWN